MNTEITERIFNVVKHNKTVESTDEEIKAQIELQLSIAKFLSPKEEHIINKIDELTQQFNKIPRLDRDKQISKIRHNLNELQEAVYLIALKRLKIK